MEINGQFLDSARKLFEYYKSLGEKAIAQLDAGQLFIAANEDTNSIAIIIKHLSGNMISRWTDFLTSDGEKEWRNRDAEFAESGGDFIDADRAKAELLDIWNIGWKCLFEALDGLTAENLSDIVYIRNEGHTVMEAINRQLAHYPYHIGQIVFYAKMLKNGAWESLSIPKNKSHDYNSDKFGREKRIGHFTDDELDKLK
ncbi:MAG: DUF1572 domain-containing protein [Flavobacterium sp.]|nr:MAG: DUF1572 domain-containing protein [Flavobacterium sp.]